MKLKEGFSISVMTESEVLELGEWVKAEGWNPGLSDLALARSLEPEAFLALRQGSSLAGGGSIFSYKGQFGFMGLFIVRKDLRRQGLGGPFGVWLLGRMKERLQPGAAIGIDGVYAMVPFYRKGGFREAYRHLRFQGVAKGAGDGAAVSERSTLRADILAYDKGLFPCAREDFLSGWIEQPGVHLSGIYENGMLAGYGVARPCLRGFKIGPLFAHNQEIAQRVLADLSSRVSGEQIQIDIPEANSAAVDLVKNLGMTEVFGCMRLYLGPNPELLVERIFGITSLEFG